MPSEQESVTNKAAELIAAMQALIDGGQRAEWERQAAARERLRIADFIASCRPRLTESCNLALQVVEDYIREDR